MREDVVEGFLAGDGAAGKDFAERLVGEAKVFGHEVGGQGGAEAVKGATKGRGGLVERLLVALVGDDDIFAMGGWNGGEQTLFELGDAGAELGRNRKDPGILEFWISGIREFGVAGTF